jgi:hypothetical protein
MTEIENYRSALRDALGRVIPLSGDLRVLLDDALLERRADEGWVHARTAREVGLLLLTGRVVELSLDNDLGDSYRREEDGSISPEELASHLPGDIEFGVGFQVIDFLEELHGVEDRPLWPQDGITLHTANPEGRDAMKRAIENLPRNLPVEVEDVTTGSKPKYLIRVLDRPESSSTGEG